MLAHPGDASQDVVSLPPLWIAAQRLPQPFVDVIQFLFQPGDVGLDPGSYGGDGAPKLVLLSHHDGYDLVSAGNQRTQDLGLGVVERAHRWTNRVGEVGQCDRVQRVGLRQSPGRPGEVSNLPGVDDGHRQRRSRQSCNRWQFQAACGIQHHYGRVLSPEP